MNTIFSLWHSIQQHLFPHMEEVLDLVTEKETSGSGGLDSFYRN
jgi:hypothetical protein